MALASMDDKLLGEKVHSYCSSSEDEDDDNSKGSGNESHSKEQKAMKSNTFIPAPKTSGRTVQTGPKGVIEDWRRYKQLETEKRERDAAEKDALCRRLAMTCQSFREEQDAKEKTKEDDNLDDDDNKFMEWYKQKRILEMQQKFAEQWAKVTFGDVHELTRDNYVEAIENEKKFVTVLIHIYDTKTPACKAVNGCFKVLAKKYKAIKFCRINVVEAKLSSNFIENGLPTIIAYKENTIIGNFVRVGDTLGDDFFASDLEEFLLEYGVLPSRHELPKQGD